MPRLRPSSCRVVHGRSLIAYSASGLAHSVSGEMRCLGGGRVQPASPEATRLARRLRQLREQQWPDARLTQKTLARAFSAEEALAAATVSSWESSSAPKLPPRHRLRAYARFFATPRSVERLPHVAAVGGAHARRAGRVQAARNGTVPAQELGGRGPRRRRDSLQQQNLAFQGLRSCYPRLRGAPPAVRPDRSRHRQIRTTQSSRPSPTWTPWRSCMATYEQKTRV